MTSNEATKEAGRWPSGHKRVSLEGRFWAKVQKLTPEECWLWTGSTDPRGRGQIYAGETKTQIAREQNVARSMVTRLLRREGAHV